LQLQPQNALFSKSISNLLKVTLPLELTLDVSLPGKSTDYAFIESFNGNFRAQLNHFPFHLDARLPWIALESMTIRRLTPARSWLRHSSTISRKISWNICWVATSAIWVG